MTILLQKAVDAVSRLDKDEQDTIAQIIIDELEDKKKWNASFARTASQLETLAKEAKAEYQSGKTKPLSS